MITPSVSTDEIKTDEIKTDNASISVTNPNKYLYKSCCLLIDKRFAEFMVKLISGAVDRVQSTISKSDTVCRVSLISSQ